MRLHSVSFSDKYHMTPCCGARGAASMASVRASLVYGTAVRFIASRSRHRCPSRILRSTYLTYTLRRNHIPNRSRSRSELVRAGHEDSILLHCSSCFCVSCQWSSGYNVSKLSISHDFRFSFPPCSTVKRRFPSRVSPQRKDRIGLSAQGVR